MSIFYFAWVEEGGTPFNALAHTLDEVDVFELEIEHSEGDFPSARISIKNPRIGLLAPGRKLWAWISWRDDAAVIHPLFHGRLVGVPEDLHNEVVQLLFIARPVDYVAQQEALAATLRVEPYWDPAWVNPDRWEEPDAVLESRTQLWHIDRLTHVVTVSDLLNGEDGNLELTPADHFYDALSITYGQAPVRQVHVEATAIWKQFGTGSIDITNGLGIAPGSFPGLVGSFSGDGLSSDWPRPEASIGGGWKVGNSTIIRVDGVEFETRYQRHDFTVDEINDAGVITGHTAFIAWYPFWEFRVHVDVIWEADRDYTEILQFDLNADVQSILTEPGQEELIVLQPKSNDLSLDANGEGLPIGDVRRRAFFPTDRGHRSINWLVMTARSHLLMRSRAVELSIATSWALGINLSCRKNVLLEDARIPGGLAAGKIIGYKLKVNGDEGRLSCDITIGCTVGKGHSVTATPGDATWVEASGYLNDGEYQYWTNREIMPIAGEVGWSLPDVLPLDDGVNLLDMRYKTCVTSLTVTGGPDEQRDAIEALPPVDNDRAYERVLSDVFTEFSLVLVPVTGGPFETPYSLDLTGLMVPRTINLEATTSIPFEDALLVDPDEVVEIRPGFYLRVHDA